MKASYGRTCQYQDLTSQSGNTEEFNHLLRNCDTPINIPVHDRAGVEFDALHKPATLKCP